MKPLYFRIEPLDTPAPAAGMFLVCWPEEHGDGRYLHNAHPDRRVIDSEAGDVLVLRRQRHRGSRCSGSMTGTSRGSKACGSAWERDGTPL
jgi:hypothetical protein